MKPRPSLRSIFLRWTLVAAGLLLGCAGSLRPAWAGGAGIHLEGGEPGTITAGPDGNLWFTELGANRIGRIGPDGQITWFTVPMVPRHIVAGGDGNLWFTTYAGIGRMSPDGQLALFYMPTRGEMPYAIAAGHDGSVWFLEDAGWAGLPHRPLLGHITPSGRIVEAPAPVAYAASSNLAVGSDGSLWLTDTDEDTIYRMQPGGQTTILDMPRGLVRPRRITAGLDGNAWLIADNIPNGQSIVRITPSGVETSFRLPGLAEDLTWGPDGAIWFTEAFAERNAIGRIGVHGQVTSLPLPARPAIEGLAGLDVPEAITAGPDGRIWFTYFYEDRLGCMDMAGHVAILALR